MSARAPWKQAGNEATPGPHRTAPPTSKSHHPGDPRSPGEAASGAGQVSCGVSVYWEWGAGVVAAGPGAHPQQGYSRCPLWGQQKKGGISLDLSVLTPCQLPWKEAHFPIPPCLFLPSNPPVMPPPGSPPDVPLAVSATLWPL